MKAIHKNIYQCFADNGIYLNYYWANKLRKSYPFNNDNLTFNLIALEDAPWLATNAVNEALKKHPELKEYTKNQHRFSTKKRDKFLRTARKKIVGISIKNKKKTIYKSISDAAKEMNRPGGCGNISAKLGTGRVAYGCVWSEYIKTKK